MVELGDLREGVAVDDVVDHGPRVVRARPGSTSSGIGTNLACQSGVVPDQTKMDELSGLADEVEAACGIELAVGLRRQLGQPGLGADAPTTSAGSTSCGSARPILLGVDPLDRDADRRPSPRRVPRGRRGDRGEDQAGSSLGRPSRQTAFGAVADDRRLEHGHRAPGDPRHRSPGRRPGRAHAPDGITVRGASSDHLVVDVGDHDVAVGDEMAFAPDYSALLRAATSPFVLDLVRP